ncbi:conserved hypothetical protein [Methanosalsum zhilinae DSM 4017]|uniref:Zn-dependent hydrolase of the beta-lactamase fold-like protein n=1 Tax=Methanosalsum zhilinae (strain DSM 4017 / NBRC 107636 / OCM 62 / WeN5) TaxID=679901 RepID=F7XQM4_METZD|nr:MBL fold metallo-hydrolase [Methanosalsum zhilinae]AEH61623.1 conserved hypothetical protein [Methanosalsum zhilinae DSM 4017]
MENEDSVKVGNVTIKWLGHAGFMIKGEDKTVYIDPYSLPEYIDFEDRADLILITHDHYDHCSQEQVQKLWKGDATVLVPESCDLRFVGDTRTVNSGDHLDEELKVKDFEIEIVPAYNIDKQFHPSGRGVGYIITIEDIRIYHAGDTDFIPQMKEISADVALLPIGGTYTMDEEEAAEAAVAISPRMVIPMHYGMIDGTKADPELFRQLVHRKNPEIEVSILKVTTK